MARQKDTERIMDLLAESPQGLSSQRIKNILNLSDERYDEVRQELLDSGHVKKKVCRGGGLNLTPKGEREAVDVHEEEVSSTVEREEELYQHLINALQREDGDEEIIFDTSRLRKRGKWQNPDVAQISINIYPRLRKREVFITTYEVKQWPKWDVNAVFEAASHARFAHDSFLVLEWPGRDFTLTDGHVLQIVRECQRFGIGLATIEPHRKTYRVFTHIDPVSKEPLDTDVENWLDYVLTRRTHAAEKFNLRMDAFDKELQRALKS